jgi:hypothetical protein
MKKIIFSILMGLSLVACTSNFEEENQNPNAIQQESLLQNNNLFGAAFPGMLANLSGFQVDDNLLNDCFARQMATGTPFASGINNTTYYPTWNTFWSERAYSIMSTSKGVIDNATKYNKPMFIDWAKLVRVYVMSKAAAIYGPVIYSKYGTQGSTVLYDKESDLYNLFFAQLDTIQTDFKANVSYKGFIKFDGSYSGDVSKWMKLVNSLRLRLAIRIAKVAPAIAKTQGEKALADAAGLILDNKDNFTTSLNGNILPLATICFDWDDTRMDAAEESFLVGLKDNRITKFFQPATDNTIYSDHPDYPYKGIRNGAYLASKGQHINFSKINESFRTVTYRKHFTAAETYFLMAEAALRGWAGAGDAKTDYESGIKASFADWGAGGVDAYLVDATSTPINYIDPTDSRNSFTSRSTITVAWNNADPIELKLEKIITQKWINTFTNSMEAWVDMRRTGYPKLPYNSKNDSNDTWGTIAPNDFIKRMPFVDSEKTSNAAGVADATTKLGGPDKISTRLWWDTGAASNF